MQTTDDESHNPTTGGRYSRTNYVACILTFIATENPLKRLFKELNCHPLIQMKRRMTLAIYVEKPFYHTTQVDTGTTLSTTPVMGLERLVQLSANGHDCSKQLESAQETFYKENLDQLNCKPSASFT